MKNHIKKLDCLRIYVPDLEEGEKFYSKSLGIPVVWRTNHEIAFGMNDGVGELVIQNEDKWNETDLMVKDVNETVKVILDAGGKVLNGPFEIKIGLCAVCEDRWGNQLVILDSSKGKLETDDSGNVISK